MSMSGNAKQNRRVRRKRLRELKNSGKAYAVIDGEIVENIEVSDTASATKKRPPVILDGKTFESVPEKPAADRPPTDVSSDEFKALVRMWASLLNPRQT